MLIKWLVFVHVLSIITFFLAHGVAAVMAFSIRRETRLERIQAMLDLSAAPVGIYLVSFLLMGISGLWMPFVLDIWNQVWVWLSIVLMLLVVIWMGRFSETTYKPLRKLAGLPYMIGNKRFDAEAPADDETIRKHIESINLRWMLLIGYGIPMVVLWLMIFKPEF